METDEKYYLKCESKCNDIGLITVSDKIYGLICSFSDWIKDNNIQTNEVDFARIYRGTGYCLVATLVTEGDMVFFQPNLIPTNGVAKLLQRIQFQKELAEIVSNVKNNL